MVDRFIPRGPARYAHQKAALRRIIETRGVCALLMDPGTGKTATTLDYASLLALKHPSREARVLVLAPLAAIDTWVSQADTYAAEGLAVWAEAVGGKIVQRAEAIGARAPGADKRGAGYRRAVALVSRHADGTPGDPRKGPDALRGDSRLVLLSMNLDAFSRRSSVSKGGTVTTTDRLVQAVEKFRPDLIVIDESHRIKSPSSLVSRAATRLRPLSPRRMILTGTVMPHSPLDVFAQWRFLAPEAFCVRSPGQGIRPMSFGAFKHRYAQMGGFMGREVTGFQRLDEMRHVMAANSITVKKKDALDLPPTTDVPVEVTLSTKEQRAYDSMKATLVAQMSSGALAAVPNRLAQMMRLRQITSGILVDSTTGTVENLGSSKARVAASLVRDTLAGERRVVVFCHFRSEISAVADAVAEKGTEVMTITGATSAREREALRRRFGDVKGHPQRIVLVAQMRTLSLAVNELVTATHAVFLSLSERRDDWVQARDRLDRLGQSGERVTFWNLVVPGTVDEVILRAHRDRNDLENAILQHLKGDAS